MRIFDVGGTIELLFIGLVVHSEIVMVGSVCCSKMAFRTLFAVLRLMKGQVTYVYVGSGQDNKEDEIW